MNFKIYILIVKIFLITLIQKVLSPKLVVVYSLIYFSLIFIILIISRILLLISYMLSEFEKLKDKIKEMKEEIIKELDKTCISVEYDEQIKEYKRNLDKIISDIDKTL